MEEFYAEVKFSSEEEAERFARSPKAVGVDASLAGSEKDGYAVRLDSDAFFGLLAVTNTTPPGLTLLYSSKEDDFRVYASMEGGRMRFYFAVKHEGVWKAAEGVYNEKAWNIQLWRDKREVLEAIRSAVVKALGHAAEVKEPKEIKDEMGNVKIHYLLLYGPHITPFLERAAERVEAKPADIALEDKRIVVKAGSAKAEVEFKLLKGSEAEFLMAQDMAQTLALYKSLKEMGVPVEITPKGVKVDGEAMWALVASAVERGAPSKLPTEVMPGVELLKVYSAGNMKLYVFRVSEKEVHYYFAVKAGQKWKTAGGKYSNRRVTIYGEAARAVAEAINAVYSEMGEERRVEVELHKGVPYIQLTNEDLRLLGLK